MDSIAMEHQKTRILVDGGYVEGNVYYFYLTNHLGNKRVVAKADGTVVQKNHYYPFGMAFAESTNEKAQPYKYNGKEYQQMHQLNLYDYSARQMDGIRFTSIDPLAEKKPWLSPYHYCSNNPVNRIDPTGMVDVDRYDQLFSGLKGLERQEAERQYWFERERYGSFDCTESASPADRFTFIGGEMTDTKNYVERDHIDDKTNNIEVSLPDAVVEGQGPKMQLFRGVAIGYSLNFDVGGGGTLNIIPAQVVHIVAGKDKGKTIILAGGALNYGTPGGSMTANLNVYDYNGISLRNFGINNFRGQSQISSLSAGELVVGGISYSFSTDNSGGVLMGTIIGLGLGYSPTFLRGCDGYIGTSNVELIP